MKTNGKIELEEDRTLAEAVRQAFRDLFSDLFQ